MGEYVSLNMGCTWKFESSLFNSSELLALDKFHFETPYVYLMVSSAPRWVASYGSSPCAGIFVFKERLWKKKIIVARVNGTRYMRVSAVMATVNIVQTLDVLMTVVNVGRV